MANGPGKVASAKSGLQVGVTEHRNANGTGGAAICIAGQKAIANGYTGAAHDHTGSGSGHGSGVVRCPDPSVSGDSKSD